MRTALNLHLEYICNATVLPEMGNLIFPEVNRNATDSLDSVLDSAGLQHFDRNTLPKFLQQALALAYPPTHTCLPLDLLSTLEVCLVLHTAQTPSVP